MNYLAHSFLTFSNEQIVGQFLQDYIKNKERFSLPDKILQGIILHREIDTFTDSHPVIHQAKQVFLPLVRLYAGAFVDVAMDYFLANDPQINSAIEWKTHSQKVYRILYDHLDFFPEKFHRMLTKMQEEDWLYHYREDWGIQLSMRNVLHMARYLEIDVPVFQTFLEHKSFLKECYQEFFPDLQKHVTEINMSFSK